MSSVNHHLIVPIPEAVAADLFGRCCRPDIAADFLADSIDGFGFLSESVETSSNSITIHFHYRRPDLLCGVMTVDRTNHVPDDRRFRVEAGGQPGVFLPLAGSWPDVCKYLTQLQGTLNGPRRTRTLE
jgi:hypothetical protein